jgi:hypothetical protein
MTVFGTPIGPGIYVVILEKKYQRDRKGRIKGLKRD